MAQSDATLLILITVPPWSPAASVRGGLRGEQPFHVQREDAVENALRRSRQAERTRKRLESPHVQFAVAHRRSAQSGGWVVDSVHSLAGCLLQPLIAPARPAARRNSQSGGALLRQLRDTRSDAFRRAAATTRGVHCVVTCSRSPHSVDCLAFASNSLPGEPADGRFTKLSTGRPN